MLFCDQLNVRIFFNNVIKCFTTFYNTWMWSVGESNHSTFTAHQVIKEVTDDQFAHLVVVAGSIDLHSINKTAVAAEYRDICVKGFCQLIGNLVWVSTY